MAEKYRDHDLGPNRELTVRKDTGLLTAVNLGAVPTAVADYVTAEERGDGVVHQTVLTLTACPVSITDEAGVVAYGGVKLYDMPAGAWTLLGAVADLDISTTGSGINATFDGDVAMGTVTASNNATLSSTEANIIPSTATPQAVGGATTADGVSTTALLATFDGTATASDVYLNFVIDDADHNVGAGPAGLSVTGTIKITWIYLGDK